MKAIFQNKYFLLIVIAIAWGSSFILIKKTLPVFSPYQIGAFRASLSGVVMLGIGLPALRRMKRRDLFWVILAGFLGNFLTVFIFPIAQVGVSSSLAGIINALDPIFTLLLGAFLFQIKSKPVQYLGAVIGFLGSIVLVMASGSDGEENRMLYTLLLVVGSALYAVSALIIEKKLHHIKTSHLSSAIFVSWMVPALFILGFSGFFTTIDYTETATWQALGNLIFLSLVNTTLVLFLFFKLVQDTSAVFASTISLLIPVVAVLWGILDQEIFTFWYALGGLLILFGVYLILEKRKKSKTFISEKDVST